MQAAALALAICSNCQYTQNRRSNYQSRTRENTHMLKARTTKHFSARAAALAGNDMLAAELVVNAILADSKAMESLSPVSTIWPMPSSAVRSWTPRG